MEETYQALPRDYIRGFLRGDGSIGRKPGFYQCDDGVIIAKIRDSLKQAGIEVSEWTSLKPNSIEYCIEVLKDDRDWFWEYIGSLGRVESWAEIAGFTDTDGWIASRLRGQFGQNLSLEIGWSQCARNEPNITAVERFLQNKGVPSTKTYRKVRGHPQCNLRVSAPGCLDFLRNVEPHLQLKMNRASGLIEYLEHRSVLVNRHSNQWYQKQASPEDLAKLRSLAAKAVTR